MRSQKTHYLKTLPQYFQALWDGKKNFELRKNDRDFRAEDILVLQEYAPSSLPTYTGRTVYAVVLYVLDHTCPVGGVGLQDGFCVMALGKAWCQQEESSEG